jgi:hypothetical protein
MRKYAKDYELVVKEDKKGRQKRTAVYRGTYFEVVLDDRRLKQFKARVLLLLLLVLVMLLIGGFLPAFDGLRQLYVALPYAASFFPLYFIADGALRLPTKQRKLRRDEVDLSLNRMKTSSIILLIFLSIVVVGELIYILIVPEAGFRLEYIFLLSAFIAALAVFLIIRLQRPIEVKVSEDQQMEP